MRTESGKKGMGKKGMVFIFLLGILAVALFMPSIYIKIHNQRGEFSFLVGEPALAALEAAHEAELRMLLIEQAGRYASLQAFQDLGLRGGTTRPACGSVSGIAVWQSEEEQCLPSKAELFSEASSLATQHADPLLTDAGQELSLFFAFRQDGEQTRTLGSSLETLETPITVSGRDLGSYRARMSFDAPIPYDSRIYDEIVDAFWGKGNILADITSCEASASLSSCITRTLRDYSFLHPLKLSLDCGGLDTAEDRLFLFCASREGTWKPGTGGLSPAPLEVRFAAFLSDLPPPPLEEIAISEEQGADGRLLISWKRSPDTDVMSYTLYSSPSFSLQGLPLTEEGVVSGGRTASALTFEAVSATLIGSLSPSCTFSGLGEACKHAIDGTRQELALNQLYLDAEGTFHALVKPLVPLPTSFAVVAADASGGKISSVKHAVDATPTDHLAPGRLSGISLNTTTKELTLSPPLEHVDGTPLVEDVLYHYFLKQGDCTDIITLQDGLIEDSTRSDAEGIRATLLAKPSDPYCIGVLAADSAGNPVYPSREDATTRLRVRPEYEGILSQLVVTITHP